MSSVRRLRRDVTDRLRTLVGGVARLRVVVLLACVLGLDAADKATIGAIAAQLEPALDLGNTQIRLLVDVTEPGLHRVPLPRGEPVSQARGSRSSRRAA